MSKQSDAKKAQGYVDKATPMTCSNCAHFKSEKVDIGIYSPYITDKNIRCGIGGFAVKKNATCNKFTF